MTKKIQITNCPTEELILYHYGELEEEASLRVEKHLQGCPDCRSELISLKDVLTQASFDVPELSKSELKTFNSRVMQNLPRRRRFGYPALGWTLAGAVVVLLSFNIQQRNNMPGPKLQSVPVQMTAEQEVLNQFELLQNLDILENLDLLQKLDRLG